MRQIRANTVEILTAVLMAASCALAILLIILADLPLMDNQVIVNISGDAFGMIICIVIFVSIFKDRLQNSNTRVFLILLVFEHNLLFWDILGWVFDGNASMIYLTEFLNHLMYALIILIPYTFWMYIYGIYSDGRLTEILRIPMRAIAAIGIAAVALNLVTGWYFTIDPDTGIYTRSYAFFMSFAVPTLETAFCSATILANEKELRRKVVFLAYILIPLLSAVMQIYNYGTSLQYQTMMLMLVVMYANIYLGRSGDLIKYEAKMAEQRAAVMVSQIQPHFLYNALTAIMNIKGNPMETRDAIAEFGHYMRKNLDSLGQINPIPVSRELDHVETYIRILKQKYSDRIDVRIDAQNSGFFIPPLTVKIILEQAIKLNLREGDGTVRMDILSHLEDDYHTISIIDMNPSEMSKEFVGSTTEDILVLQKRLQSMVGGDITNELHEDGSIHCKIRIPAIKEDALWT